VRLEGVQKEGSVSQVHPDDVLVVGTFAERSLHRHWPERQVVSLGSLHRLRGRTVRHAYLTGPAWRHPKFTELYLDLRTARVDAIRKVEEWKPEQRDVLAEIAALPEQAASRSRDFGRGYALAIRDVIELLQQEV
jgi:hypothetical protein